MRIDFFTDKNIEDLIDVNVESLPYTFLKSYKQFVEHNYTSKVLIAIAKEEGIYIVLSVNKSKFIINAQLLSEPFLNSMPLAIERQGEFFSELFLALKSNNIANRIITPQNFVILGKAPKEAKSCNFGSYVVDLTPKQETLFSNIHSKHRNKINKAEKAGVVIVSGESQLQVFYNLYSDTMRRSNMFCETFDYFKSLYSCLGENHCICSVVYHYNVPQGALLAPFTKYCCYYIYGASANSITESGSINYLHWQTFLTMKSLGVKAYDFVGARLSDVSNTKLEGIQSFKERFGGRLKKGYLFKIDINYSICFIYDSLVKASNILRNRKNFKDIIDQENEK